MKKEKLILILLILGLFLVNYPILDDAVTGFIVQEDLVIVSRVIDGDTIELGDGERVRLLGINTPEKGEVFYEEAKEFLIDEIENKSVKLELGKREKDRYGRTLAYIYYNGRNVNSEIVRLGYGNPYFLEEDRLEKDIRDSYDECLDLGVGLCKRSGHECSDCIKLVELGVNSQKATFKNNCNIQCDLTSWSVKDEGRKKYIFPKTILNSGEEIVLTAEDFEENYVWTKTGDSLFLRDLENGLVLYYNY
jgi:hypothetical protein